MRGSIGASFTLLTLLVAVLACLAAAPDQAAAQQFGGASARSRMSGGSGMAGDEWDRLPAKHSYKQAFKKPFFLYNGSREIPHWEAFGSVIANPDFVRLTSSVPAQKGGIWNQVNNEHKNWQVEIAFQVNGRAYMGGDGFGFWYTQERMEAGEVYGFRDAWRGLGILFDTSDPVENRATPYIYAIYNDGTRRIAGQRATQIPNNGACFRDYRNLGVKVWARITYTNHTLRVDLDLKGGGHNYVECFTTTNFPDLPTGYHFGLSAQTGYRGADDHDFYAFETYELYPAGLDPSKVGVIASVGCFNVLMILTDVSHNPQLPKRPHEEDHEKKGQAFKISSDTEKRLRDIEIRDEEEEGVPHEAMTPQLARTIQETQLKIIESLVGFAKAWTGRFFHVSNLFAAFPNPQNALHTFLAARPSGGGSIISSDQPGGGGGQPINNAIIEHKVDELSSKITQTENELRQIKDMLSNTGRKIEMMGQQGQPGRPGPGGNGGMAECQRMLAEIQNSLRHIGVGFVKGVVPVWCPILFFLLINLSLSTVSNKYNDLQNGPTARQTSPRKLVARVVRLDFGCRAGPGDAHVDLERVHAVTAGQGEKVYLSLGRLRKWFEEVEWTVYPGRRRRLGGFSWKDECRRVAGGVL